jgi:hypothetical protein
MAAREECDISGVDEQVAVRHVYVAVQIVGIR